MDEIELLICQNIKSLKNREKKFDHFGDYLITFATLFGLSSNTWINLIKSDQEKYTFNFFIAMVLEMLYITAISMKITSHYSVKAYITAYKKKEKEIQSKLKTPSTDLKELDSQKVNLSIINSLVPSKNIKNYWNEIFLIMFSIFLYEIVLYVTVIYAKSSWLLIGIIIPYICILFPLFFIPVVKKVCQYYLIIGIPENRFTNYLKKLYY